MGNIVQNKTTLPIAFILHEGENNNKGILSTNFPKPCIENQNHENLLIISEMCEETGYGGIRKKNSIPEQLCENGFINCDTTIETK